MSAPDDDENVFSYPNGHMGVEVYPNYGEGFIAVSLPSNVWLRPSEARQLARMLVEAADEVEASSAKKNEAT